MCVYIQLSTDTKNDAQPINLSGGESAGGIDLKKLRKQDRHSALERRVKEMGDEGEERGRK